mmetsp:Transcript_5603/g.9044  ORF Transcript_5603/g.9044 Transcript_5603/m.9044 type:complete len:569 (+) Transcript_5603:171-1877(+)
MADDAADTLEMPGQPYAFALWNLIIRPPRRRYDLSRLGPEEFRLWSCGVKRVDINLTNSRKQKFRCSHFLPQVQRGVAPEPYPAVIYLHQNASCRLEALQLVPLFLPLGISVFCFDFAGCGESEGEYISLGWYERDDLAQCVEYLRGTGTVSAIGLWGRSMGAVTTLLHADRDHSIGGMVLDSPFCNLRQLVGELAQSEYLSLKVPSWLLSGALAMGRLRIKSLCNFDIDQLSPEQHVGNTFIPALFLHGADDDFIAPRHTQKLFEAYNGDKELELVEGDHNSARDLQVIRKAVTFFCRAFRVNLSPSRHHEGNLAAVLGFHSVDADGAVDRRILSRQVLYEAARLLAVAGSDGKSLWLGERLRAVHPFRIDGAMQLMDSAAEAGFCIALFPAPTEYGGANRPPAVFFALASANGLVVSKAIEGQEPKVVARSSGQLELGVPVLCIIEMLPPVGPSSGYFGPVRPPQLRLSLGEGGSEILLFLPEEYDPEALVWPVTRGGDAEFFDIDLKDQAWARNQIYASDLVPSGVDAAEADRAPRSSEGQSDPAAPQAPQAAEESSSGSGCRQQ